MIKFKYVLRHTTKTGLISHNFKFHFFLGASTVLGASVFLGASFLGASFLGASFVGTTFVAVGTTFLVSFFPVSLAGTDFRGALVLVSAALAGTPFLTFSTSAFFSSTFSALALLFFLQSPTNLLYSSTVFLVLSHPSFFSFL